MPKRSNTKPKDPNMPKRPLSSYFLFSNERRSILQQKMPEKKLTDLSKIISQEWKELDGDKKEQYAARAKRAKEKWDKQLAAYKQTEDYDKFQQKLEFWKQQQKEQEKADKDGSPTKKISLPRKPKDPNMPKRSASSYFLFGNSVRQEIKNENPTLKVTEIAKLIGERWGKLTEEEKKPFNAQAATLKAEYLRRMEKYRGSAEEAEFKKKLEEWEEECERRKAKAVASAQRKKAKEMKERAKAKAKKGGTKGTRGRGRRKQDESSMDEESSSEESSSDSGSDSDSSSSGSVSESGSESDSS